MTELLLSPEIKFFMMVVGLVYFSVSFLNVGVGLVIMSVAMLFSPEFSLGHVGARAITIRVEDLMIPLLLMAWLGRRAVHRDSQLLVPNPVNKPIFLILAMDILSTVWGITQGWTFQLSSVFYFLKTLEFFLIFFLVVNYVRTLKQIKFFLFFSLLTVVMLGIYALSQIPHNEVFSDFRITAPFEGTPEPATIGGYMAFLLLIITCLFLYEKRPLGKWMYGAIGLVTFLPFLFTLNRTSYIAFSVGLVFIAVTVKRKWFSFFLIFFFLSSPLWVPHSIKERIAYTWEDAVNPGREWGVDQSTQERINTYRKMWNTWKYSPIIGCGLGSYDFLDSQYARTLHEIGIVGLGIWLWAFFRLFRISRWLFKTLPDGALKGMTLGYSAGIIGILLHCFGTITFYIVRIMEPFWFMSGLVTSLYLATAARMKEQEELKNEEEKEEGSVVSETVSV